MVAAVECMAATGVDFIKIGFFFHARACECANALSGLASSARLIAVLFADEPYDLALVDDLARNGFAGAMLDTAHKTGKTLREWRTGNECEEFVTRGRSHGLLTGLAGSLRREDVPALLAIGPDYLGFRGALCRFRQRDKILDREALEEIRDCIPVTTTRVQRIAA
jgi:uncharacterized protein (UPF0264 family)